MNKVIFIGKSFVLGKCQCGCKNEISIRVRYGGTLQRFKSGHNPGFPTGDKHWNWTGGRTIDKRGYVLIRKNGKRVKEHRVIYEEYYKCCLLSWAIIHHINDIKTDNRPENLEAMRQKQHVLLHHIKIMSDRFCYICKSETTYITKNGTPSWNKSKLGYFCMKCYLKQYYKKRKMKII